MHWDFLIFHTVFKFGEQLPLFIYIDYMFYRKKIVRIICGVHPRTHTEPLYKSLNILNIDQIRDYSIALFTYKLTKHLLPPLFENMFIKTSDVHNYSTRHADLLYVQFAATKRTQRTLKHYGIKLWNSLYHVVHPDYAISTFKCNLKSFPLSWYFYIIIMIMSVFYRANFNSDKSPCSIALMISDRHQTESGKVHTIW